MAPTKEKTAVEPVPEVMMVPSEVRITCQVVAPEPVPDPVMMFVARSIVALTPWHMAGDDAR